MAKDITKLTRTYMESIDAEISRLRVLKGQLSELIRTSTRLSKQNKSVSAKNKTIGRTVSAESRARMAAAQKLRWARKKRAAKKAAKALAA